MLQDFKRVLAENGAEFADSFVKNLHRTIKYMKPSTDSKPTTGKKPSSAKSSKLERLAESMPFLALPDEERKPDIASDDKPTLDTKDDALLDDMAFLESMAPSKNKGSAAPPPHGH